MCELTHGMAGERHGRGMLCMNRPLGRFQFLVQMVKKNDKETGVKLVKSKA
jgi:hypothetical protein